MGDNESKVDHVSAHELLGEDGRSEATSKGDGGEEGGGGGEKMTRASCSPVKRHSWESQKRCQGGHGLTPSKQSPGGR